MTVFWAFLVILLNIDLKFYFFCLKSWILCLSWFSDICHEVLLTESFAVPSLFESLISTNFEFDINLASPWLFFCICYYSVRKSSSGLRSTFLESFSVSYYFWFMSLWELLPWALVLLFIRTGEISNRINPVYFLIELANLFLLLVSI